MFDNRAYKIVISISKNVDLSVISISQNIDIL